MLLWRHKERSKGATFEAGLGKKEPQSGRLKSTAAKKLERGPFYPSLNSSEGQIYAGTECLRRLDDSMLPESLRVAFH